MKGVLLDSYIVSATPFEELRKRWGELWVDATRDDFAERHVLFDDDIDERIGVIAEN